MVTLIQSKGGIWNVAKRACAMLIRHGIGSAKMENNIKDMNELCREHGITPTFFMTINKTSSFDFHPLQIAAHGFNHDRYTQVPKDVWLDDLQRLFDLRYTEFRAPYMDVNDEMILDLAKSEFDFDSSKTYNFPILKESSREYWLSLMMYKPIKTNLPYLVEDLVEIPVSLPDDEQMIDRLHMTSDEMYLQMLSMIDQAVRDETMVVLNLHAERFPLFKVALKQILSWALCNDYIWMTDLPTLARWWKTKPKNVRWPEGKKMALCVSSDIDRLSFP